jgi:hypothetical protein
VNLSEGTRRLALLLGVVGAILGGFASYLQLQSVMDQQVRHKRFEQLANSDVVKQARLARNATQLSVPAKVYLDDDGNPISAGALTTDQAIQALRGLPEDRQRAILAKLSPEVKQGILAKLKVAPPADPASGRMVDPWAKYEITEPNGTPLDSEVNKGGISTIHWAKDYSVGSIETEPNLYLYPGPATGAWEYLLIVLFPILGFFIPWGVVRAIGWVGAGFVQSS